MAEYITTVELFSGGKVTVPKTIRKKMELKDGDLIEIVVRNPSIKSGERYHD